MKPVKSFSQFGIQAENHLSGKKIGIKHILNREITVKDFQISPSKYPNEGNGMRLTLQFIVDNEECVVLTGSVVLQDQIKKVAKEDFPFTTTIIPLTPMGYKFT